MSFWPVNKDFYFDVTFMPSSGFMYFLIFPNMRSPAKHFFYVLSLQYVTWLQAVQAYVGCMWAKDNIIKPCSQV